jgi:hypothetical protein
LATAALTWWALYPLSAHMSSSQGKLRDFVEHEHRRALAVLDARRVDDDAQRQTLRVDHRMNFPALRLRSITTWFGATVRELCEEMRRALWLGERQLKGFAERTAVFRFDCQS